MKRNISIRLKAAFLLIVFGLNIMLGFACAMGIDMGFNTSHHHDEEATQVNMHHHHDEAEEHQHDKKDGSQNDDCCNDKVVKLSQADKAIPQSNTLVNPIFFTAFISSYYNIVVLYHSQVTASIRYFVRSYHPPIPDIRIAIRSFQI